MKKKERKILDDVHLNQTLKEITGECEKLAKDNTALKVEMKSVAMKFTKEIEQRKKNEKNLA